MNRPEYLQDIDVVSVRFQASTCFLHVGMSKYVFTWWCFVSNLTEERCLRSLGTISWLGAHWHNTKKVLRSQSGRQCYGLLWKKGHLMCSSILSVKHAYLIKTGFRKKKQGYVSKWYFSVYLFCHFCLVILSQSIVLFRGTRALASTLKFESVWKDLFLVLYTPFVWVYKALTYSKKNFHVNLIYKM